jgi:hypothetical protein
MQPFAALRAARLASIERSPFILPAITVWLSVIVFFLTRHHVGVVAFLRGAKDESWTVVAGSAVFSLALLFSFAHLIETLSDLLLERTLADRLTGFPHERVIPFAGTTVRYRQFIRRQVPVFSRRFSQYEGSRIIVLAVVFSEPMVVIFRSEAVQSHTFLRFLCEVLIGYFCLAAATSILLLLPGFAAGFNPVDAKHLRFRWVVERLRKLRALLRNAPISQTVFRNWKYVIWWPALVSYAFCDRIIRYMLRLNGEIDEVTYKRFEVVFRDRLQIDFESISNNDRFWLTYFVLLADSPGLIKPIAAARHLANFCRNQCLALFVASIALTLSYRLGQPDVAGFVTRNDVNNLALICAFGSWVFYWKFLQGYYYCTKMTFRAFATIRGAAGAI